jgi:hypothetical protein
VDTSKAAEPTPPTADAANDVKTIVFYICILMCAIALVSIS